MCLINTKLLLQNSPERAFLSCIEASGITCAESVAEEKPGVVPDSPFPHLLGLGGGGVGEWNGINLARSCLRNPAKERIVESLVNKSIQPVAPAWHLP